MDTASVNLSSDKKYLVFNKSPFFWLADTWWYGATNRARWPDPFKSLVQDRKQKGFTVIQIVVGYPPETDINSKNAENGGGSPFDKFGEINPKYFDEVDQKIKYIIENGLIPCIVGGWGYHIDKFGVEKIKNLWREIIKHYQDLPAIFCIAGEVDINYLYLDQKTQHFLKRIYRILPESFRKGVRKIRDSEKITPGFNLEERIKKWEEAADFIKREDRGKHLITAHVYMKDTADNLFNHPKWLDINSIQSGHSKDSVEFMVSSVRKSKKMIVNMEPWYEGILENFDDYYQRLAFWLCVLSGAKGHTYGAHGVWQMSNDDNFMGHWGASDWRKSVKFAGAAQLGRSVKFLKKYEWWKLAPSFAKISPEWNSDNTYFPITADIENKYTFIYFPDITIKQKFLFSKSQRPSEISWIDPITLATIHNEKYKGIEFPKWTKSRDLLCVMGYK